MKYKNRPKFVERPVHKPSCSSFIYPDTLVGLDGEEWGVSTNLITGPKTLYLEFTFTALAFYGCSTGYYTITLPLPDRRPDAFGLAVILELAKTQV